MLGTNAHNTSPTNRDDDTLVVVSLAAVTWDFRLVGRTRMLSEAWHRCGQPSVFVQVPSLRTALQRVLSPLSERAVVPVVRPWPAYPARMWHRVSPTRLAGTTRRRAIGLRKQLDRLLPWDRSVALVVSPIWTPWLDELPFRHVVYDCIDDLEVHVKRPELAPLYRQWEDELVARANGAVVTAETLGTNLRARRADLPIALIRNGVDVDWFQGRAASTPRPGDVPTTHRPVIGFVGALYDWIDWELIRQTANRLPDFDFVLVGPHDGRGDIRRVASLPNVHLLGARPYAQVPAYVETFSACWVPFKQNDVGAAANPVKIYEYLALGKPVVSTPVADTDSFGPLLQVARDADQMAAGLRAVLELPPGLADSRIQFARQNDWAIRAREYVDFVTGLGTPAGPADTATL